MYMKCSVVLIVGSALHRCFVFVFGILITFSGQTRIIDRRGMCWLLLEFFGC